MENYRLPILVASILGCMLIILVSLFSIRQLQMIRGDAQLLSVSATAKAESIPDTAVVTIGVLTEAQTAKEAKTQNTQQMNQVLAFIKQTGIEDPDIKTSQFNIAPKYNYNNQQQTVVGYQANQTITVKVKNIYKSSEQLESIVDGAVLQGANQIQGVDFFFANNEDLMQNARKKAIARAIENAQQIAKDAGMQLGRVVNVITADQGAPSPMFMSTMALAKANSSQIEPGSQNVVETVTVLFATR